MRDHVLRICRTSFYQLRQLRVIRGSISTETCTALVHAFVSSRLDYCNSLFAGLSDDLINKLQSVLRSVARLVLRKRKFDHVTDDLRDQLVKRDGALVEAIALNRRVVGSTPALAVMLPSKFFTYSCLCASA